VSGGDLRRLIVWRWREGRQAFVVHRHPALIAHLLVALSPAHVPACRAELLLNCSLLPGAWQVDACRIYTATPDRPSSFTVVDFLPSSVC
jgi:hypothetical protein